MDSKQGDRFFWNALDFFVTRITRPFWLLAGVYAVIWSTMTPVGFPATIEIAGVPSTEIEVNGQIQLNRSAAGDAGEFRGHKVQRATTGGGPRSTNIQVNPRSYLNTGLTDGTTDSYRAQTQDLSDNQKAVSSMESAAQSAPSRGSSTVLTLTGDGNFAINGLSTFLLGMSYYDAANHHTSDIDYLAARGFKLLVVHADDVLRNDANSLYNSDGTLQAAKQAAIQALISYADTKGMVVDLNCLYADVDGTNSAALLTTSAARTAAVANCVNAFKTNSNVMFSIVNEHNYGSFSESHAEMSELMRTARTACAACIMSYSSSEHFGTPESGAGSEAHLFTSRAGSSIYPTHIQAEIDTTVNHIMPHNDRTTGWHLLTTARAGSLRAYLDSIGLQEMPVLFEEDGFIESGGVLASAEEWITVAQDCKAAGCAGWVLNSNTTFSMNPSTMMSQVGAIAQEAIDRIGAALASTAAYTRKTASSSNTFTPAK